MRVLHVTPYFAPAFVYGGPPRSILGLCRSLQAAGVDVEVVTTVANGASDLPASPPTGSWFDGIPVYYAARAFPRRFFGAEIRPAIERALARADVCHIHGLWNMPAWQASRMARQAGVPVVISPRGMLQPAALAHRALRKRIAFPLLDRRHLETAACLHATTEDEAATLRHFFPTSRVVVMPNGVDGAPRGDVGSTPRSIRERFNIPRDTSVVLFLGRLHPIKRIDLLAGAVKTLRLGGRSVTLVLAGPNEADHLSRLSPIVQPLAESVRYVGEVDEPSKWDLLRESAALVLCSDSENFGVSVAEALAAARPVVVTKTCPWRDVETHGCGFWVDQTSEAIATAIEALLSNPEEAAAMGRRGACLAARRYSWPAIGRAMADCYQSILDGRVGQ